MTDKEELLKAIEQKRQEIWPTDTHEMAPATVPNNLEQGWLNALRWMVSLIKSLADEQQPSEELEEKIEGKINEYWNEWFSHGDYFEGTLPKNVFAAYCHKIAQWQKEQMMRSAVDATCVLLPPPDLFKVLICHDVTNNLSKGQKVKIITVTVKEDEQLNNKVNVEPPSFEESQGEFNSYNVALNG